MKNLLTILIISFSLCANAQKPNLDSLLLIWNDPGQADTTRLNAVHDIAHNIYLYSQPDSAFNYAQLQFKFAEEKRQKKHIGLALNTLGICYSNKSDYLNAMDYFNGSLKIMEEISDTIGIAICIRNIGNVHFMRCDYLDAINYYKRSLKINEKIGNKQGICDSFQNIGNCYFYKGIYSKAIEYYTRGLKIAEEIGYKDIAGILHNIGAILYTQGDYYEAIDYYNRSLDIYLEAGNKRGICYVLNNIGRTFKTQGNFSGAIDYFYRSLEIAEEIGNKIMIATILKDIGANFDLQGDGDKALDYYSRSLRINEELGDKLGISHCLTRIGENYIDNGKYSLGIDYNTKALALAQEIEAIVEISNASKNLYIAYKQIGKHKESLEMHEQYIIMRDSTNNIDEAKEVIRMKLEYEYEKQALADSITYSKQIEINKLQYRTERYNLLGGFGIIMLLIAVYLWIRSSKKRAEKNILLYEINNLKILASVKILSPGVLPESFQLEKTKIENAIHSNLNISDWKILETLYYEPSISNQQIAETVSLSVDGVRSSLRKMYRLFDIHKSDSNQRFALILKAIRLSTDDLSKTHHN